MGCSDRPAYFCQVDGQLSLSQYRERALERVLMHHILQILQQILLRNPSVMERFR